MAAALGTCAALFLLVLASGRWCLARVEREYADGGLLSVGTVWLVWIVYGLELALVVIPAVGAWGSLPGPPLLWRTLGLPLVVLGLSFAAWGAISFHSLRRMNGRDTSELVTTGAYRFSRNPQNVGIAAALLGVALLGPSSVALAATALFCGMFRIYLSVEERFLESTYGDRYRAYRAATHRYLGARSVRLQKRRQPADRLPESSNTMKQRRHSVGMLAGAIAMLLTGSFAGVPGLVLCVGSNGHRAIELEHRATECPALAGSRGASGTSLQAPGACLDIPAAGTGPTTPSCFEVDRALPPLVTRMAPIGEPTPPIEPRLWEPTAARAGPPNLALHLTSTILLV
ncbi:MAG: methyltransferase family protein [Myxococcota bacterium]